MLRRVPDPHLHAREARQLQPVERRAEDGAGLLEGPVGPPRHHERRRGDFFSVPAFSFLFLLVFLFQRREVALEGDVSRFHRQAGPQGLERATAAVVADYGD